MMVKMKNRLHRNNINRTRPRIGYEYTNYRMCLSMIVVMCNNQQLSKSEAEFMKKLSNTEGFISVAYKKSV